ncbi:hypothetical protein ACFSLT_30010 [Novosphingobium resinovorum]
MVRYLRRQRGRRWDAVFSEICAKLDTGSTVKMHVREHVEDFVLTRISIRRYGEWMFEGQVLGGGTSGSQVASCSSIRVTGFSRTWPHLRRCSPLEWSTTREARNDSDLPDL